LKLFRVQTEARSFMVNQMRLFDDLFNLSRYSRSAESYPERTKSPG